jgi:hypothetical protein
MEHNSAHVTLLNIQDCLGVDGLIHHGVHWEDNALCGVAIQRKKFKHVSGMYNCYECDLKIDELVEAEDIELRSTKNV